MPCFRGLEVCLVALPGSTVIEEYPHPDASSLRLVTREEAAAAFTNELSLASSSNGSVQPSIPNLKANPKVSVYIASQPGKQFIVKYGVTNIPGCKYLQFKMFINGRMMTTCGQDITARPQGLISQTVWLPFGQYEQQTGFEGRQFMFMSEEDGRSAAEDGGLIEIQVFRAEAANPLAPKVEQFRPLPNYGITTPSTGLLEKPEEVRWFQYKLLDAKDSPYARFLFHYRSYENLRELNLLPEEYGRGNERQEYAEEESMFSDSSSGTHIPCFDGPGDDRPVPHRPSRRRDNDDGSVQDRSRSHALTLPEVPEGMDSDDEEAQISVPRTVHYTRPTERPRQVDVWSPSRSSRHRFQATTSIDRHNGDSFASRTSRGFGTPTGSNHTGVRASIPPGPTSSSSVSSRSSDLTSALAATRLGAGRETRPSSSRSSSLSQDSYRPIVRDPSAYGLQPHRQRLGEDQARRTDRRTDNHEPVRLDSHGGTEHSETQRSQPTTDNYSLPGAPSRAPPGTPLPWNALRQSGNEIMRPGRRSHRFSFHFPLGRRNSNRDSRLSLLSASSTTPSRPVSFDHQRWSPPNYRPQSRGVTATEVLREQHNSNRVSRTSETIDRVIAALNSPDQDQENRPPSDDHLFRGDD